jgi:branched-chain amino acid transport system ATP-binding protein
MMADDRTAVILVEQHAAIALSLTADAILLERGTIVHRAPSAQLAHDAAMLDRYIGVKVDG